MATDISIEAAGPLLREAVGHLRPGEKVNLIGPDGKQIAVVMSLSREAEGPLSPDEWLARLDARAERIGKAWKSEKSAVEIISEMRR